MSGRPETLPTVPSIVFDMDEDVSALVHWSKLVRDLGTCGSPLDAGGLYVMGLAMVERAEKVREDWARLFDMTR